MVKGLRHGTTVCLFLQVVVTDLGCRVKGFLDVELSSGQMIEDVRLAVNGKKPVYFHGRMGGNLPTQKEILDEIVKIHKGEM